MVEYTFKRFKQIQEIKSTAKMEMAHEENAQKTKKEKILEEKSRITFS